MTKLQLKINVLAALGLFLLSYASAFAGGKKMVSDPLLLTINVDTIKVTIKLANISEKPYMYLHHQFIAPVLLRIISENGDTLAYNDRRAKMRYNKKVGLKNFQMLEPGNAKILTEMDFLKENDNTYSVQCDAFTFRSIKAGKYKISAEWRSWVDQYYNSETQKYVQVDNAWKGTLLSEEILLELP